MIIDQKDKNSVALAIETLRAGKVLAIPTDTVYGLAVCAKNQNAIEELYKIKGRDPEKPVAIFVKNLAAAKEIFHFSDLALDFANKFLPGKLTMILEMKPDKSQLLPENLNLKNDGFLGFRIVENYFLNRLFAEFDEILAVSSANPSGKPAANNAAMVASYFKDLLVIDGGTLDCEASTVIKFFKDEFKILREGEISRKFLAKK